jgi:hypothetical protein
LPIVGEDQIRSEEVDGGLASPTSSVRPVTSATDRERTLATVDGLPIRAWRPPADVEGRSRAARSPLPAVALRESTTPRAFALWRSLPVPLRDQRDGTAEGEKAG